MDKSFPNPSKTLAKHSQNPSQTLPNRSKIKKATKTTYVEKKTVLGQCPPRSWTPFWRPKASQERPKRLPKPSPNPPKSKQNQISATKTIKVKKKLSWVNVPHPLGRHFGRPRPPKRGPRASQKLSKSRPKSENNDV